MDDPDPLVTEDKVPSYEAIKEKLKEIDHTIIIYRIYYLLTTFKYRFQLIKKNQMCIIEIPRAFLESYSKNGMKSEQQLTKLINSNIENETCWRDIN